MQLPPGCCLYYCAVAGCCAHKQNLGRNEGAVMSNLTKMMPLWLQLLLHWHKWYLSICVTWQLWLTSLVRNELKPHGTRWHLCVIIHHGLLSTPLHWLSDLSWRSKEAIQFGRPPRPVIPPQQEGINADTACVSGLPTTQFPLWNSHGFLELRCRGKWSDQISLFPVTQNQNPS